MTEQQLYMLLASLTAKMQEANNMAPLLVDRACVFVSLAKYPEALADLDKVIKMLDGGNDQCELLAQAYKLRGQINFQLHDETTAYDDLRRAVDLNPEMIQSMSGEYESKSAPKGFLLNYRKKK